MSWLFFDYETTGIDFQKDWPLQFAACRTDENFNIVEEMEVFCRVPMDILPSPEATIITGLTPQAVNAKGVIEPTFAEKIHQWMVDVPSTCLSGYNVLGFDRPLSRQIFYRNFLDPYLPEWNAGNSYFDIFPLARMMQALRPEGLTWPRKEDGSLDLRLSSLTAANGIEQEKAHDALSDVKATVGLAKQIKSAQPKLFTYLFGLRQKKKAHEALASFYKEPFVYCGAGVSKEFSYTTLASVVLLKGDMAVLADLRINPDGWLEDPKLWDRENPGLLVMKMNAGPTFAPLSVLTQENCDRLSLNIDEARKHWEQIQSASELEQTIEALLHKPESGPLDNELGLYSGFASDQDRQLTRQYRASNTLWDSSSKWVDERFHTLLQRGRARHFEETLSVSERKAWQGYCYERVISGTHHMSTRTLTDFNEDIQRLKQTYSGDKDKMDLLNKLQEWGAHVGHHAELVTLP